MALNAMFGVGLFLPLVTALEDAQVLNPIQIGVLAGAFPVAEGLAALAYPHLVRGRSLKLCMAAGQALCGLSCIALMASDSFWVLLIGRIIGGAGGASLSLAQLIVGKSHGGPERVRRLGEIGAAQAFGLVSGLVLTGFFLAALGPVAGLRSVVVVGFTTGISAAIWLLQHDYNMAGEISEERNLREVFGHPMLNMLLMYALNTFIYISLAIQLAVWMADQRWAGPAGTSIVFVVLAISTMAFQSRVSAWAVTMVGTSRTVAGGFLACAIGSALFAINLHPALVIFGLFIARLGYSLIVPASLSIIIGDGHTATSRYRAGQAMFFASIGSGVGPVIVGALNSVGSLQMSAAGLSALALIAGLYMISTFPRIAD